MESSFSAGQFSHAVKEKENMDQNDHIERSDFLVVQTSSKSNGLVPSSYAGDDNLLSGSVESCSGGNSNKSSRHMSPSYEDDGDVTAGHVSAGCDGLLQQKHNLACTEELELDEPLGTLSESEQDKEFLMANETDGDEAVHRDVIQQAGGVASDQCPSGVRFHGVVRQTKQNLLERKWTLNSSEVYKAKCCECTGLDREEIPLEQIFLKNGQMFRLPDANMLRIGCLKVYAFKRSNGWYIALCVVLNVLGAETGAWFLDLLNSGKFPCQLYELSEAEAELLSQKCDYKPDTDYRYLIHLQVIREICAHMMPEVDNQVVHMLANGKVGVKVLGMANVRCSVCGLSVKNKDGREECYIGEDLKCEKRNAEMKSEMASVGVLKIADLNLSAFEIHGKQYLNVSELVWNEIVSTQPLKRKLQYFGAKLAIAPLELEDRLMEQNELAFTGSEWVDVSDLRCVVCRDTCKQKTLGGRYDYKQVLVSGDFMYKPFPGKIPVPPLQYVVNTKRGNRKTKKQESESTWDVVENKLEEKTDKEMKREMFDVISKMKCLQGESKQRFKSNSMDMIILGTGDYIVKDIVKLQELLKNEGVKTLNGMTCRMEKEEPVQEKIEKKKMGKTEPMQEKKEKKQMEKNGHVQEKKKKKRMEKKEHIKEKKTCFRHTKAKKKCKKAEVECIEGVAELKHISVKSCKQQHTSRTEDYLSKKAERSMTHSTACMDKSSCLNLGNLNLTFDCNPVRNTAVYNEADDQVCSVRDAFIDIDELECATAARDLGIIIDQSVKDTVVWTAEQHSANTTQQFDKATCILETSDVFNKQASENTHAEEKDIEAEFTSVAHQSDCRSIPLNLNGSEQMLQKVTDCMKSPENVSSVRKSPQNVNNRKESPQNVSKDLESPRNVSNNSMSLPNVSDEWKSPQNVSKDWNNPQNVSHGQKSQQNLTDSKASPEKLNESRKNPQTETESKLSPKLNPVSINYNRKRPENGTANSPVKSPQNVTNVENISHSWAECQSFVDVLKSSISTTGSSDTATYKTVPANHEKSALKSRHCASGLLHSDKENIALNPKLTVVRSSCAMSPPKESSEKADTTVADVYEKKIEVLKELNNKNETNFKVNQVVVISDKENIGISLGTKAKKRVSFLKTPDGPDEVTSNLDKLKMTNIANLKMGLAHTLIQSNCKEFSVGSESTHTTEEMNTDVHKMSEQPCLSGCDAVNEKSNQGKQLPKKKREKASRCTVKEQQSDKACRKAMVENIKKFVVFARCQDETGETQFQVQRFAEGAENVFPDLLESGNSSKSRCEQFMEATAEFVKSEFEVIKQRLHQQHNEEHSDDTNEKLSAAKRPSDKLQSKVCLPDTVKITSENCGQRTLTGNKTDLGNCSHRKPGNLSDNIQAKGACSDSQDSLQLCDKTIEFENAAEDHLKRESNSMKSCLNQSGTGEANPEGRNNEPLDLVEVGNEKSENIGMAHEQIRELETDCSSQFTNRKSHEEQLMNEKTELLTASDRFGVPDRLAYKNIKQFKDSSGKAEAPGVEQLIDNPGVVVSGEKIGQVQTCDIECNLGFQGRGAEFVCSEINVVEHMWDNGCEDAFDRMAVDNIHQEINIDNSCVGQASADVEWDSRILERIENLSSQNSGNVPARQSGIKLRLKKLNEQFTCALNEVGKPEMKNEHGTDEERKVDSLEISAYRKSRTYIKGRNHYFSDKSESDISVDVFKVPSELVTDSSETVATVSTRTEKSNLKPFCDEPVPSKRNATGKVNLSVVVDGISHHCTSKKRKLKCLDKKKKKKAKYENNTVEIENNSKGKLSMEESRHEQKGYNKETLSGMNSKKRRKEKSDMIKMNGFNVGKVDLLHTQCQGKQVSDKTSEKTGVKTGKIKMTLKRVKNDSNACTSEVKDSDNKHHGELKLTLKKVRSSQPNFCQVAYTKGSKTLCQKKRNCKIHSGKLIRKDMQLRNSNLVRAGRQRTIDHHLSGESWERMTKCFVLLKKLEL